jgi:thymidylate synthase (FAD)
MSFVNTSRVVNLKNKISFLGNAGFVKIVDVMPRVIPDNCKSLMCDHAIIQAARVSLNEGIKTPEKDVKLIDFLIRHKHTSPFEMVKFKFHVKTPIFVQRQWIRHRMASVNEISGRYSVIEPEFYYPKAIYDQGKMNKQMSGNKIECKNTNELFQTYMDNSMKQYNTYNLLISKGVLVRLQELDFRKICIQSFIGVLIFIIFLTLFVLDLHITPSQKLKNILMQLKV